MDFKVEWGNVYVSRWYFESLKSQSLWLDWVLEGKRHGYHLMNLMMVFLGKIILFHVYKRGLQVWGLSHFWLQSFLLGKRLDLPLRASYIFSRRIISPSFLYLFHRSIYGFDFLTLNSHFYRLWRRKLSSSMFRTLFPCIPLRTWSTSFIMKLVNQSWDERGMWSWNLSRGMKEKTWMPLVIHMLFISTFIFRYLWAGDLGAFLFF